LSRHEPLPLESGPDLKTDGVTVETENMTSYPGGAWLGREVGEGFSRRMARLPAGHLFPARDRRIDIKRVDLDALAAARAIEDRIRHERDGFDRRMQA
jgi:hypothetical protein